MAKKRVKFGIQEIARLQAHEVVSTFAIVATSERAETDQKRRREIEAITQYSDIYRRLNKLSISPQPDSLNGTALAASINADYGRTPNFGGVPAQSLIGKENEGKTQEDSAQHTKNTRKEFQGLRRAMNRLAPRRGKGAAVLSSTAANLTPEQLFAGKLFTTAVGGEKLLDKLYDVARIYQEEKQRLGQNASEKNLREEVEKRIDIKTGGATANDPVKERQNQLNAIFGRVKAATMYVEYTHNLAKKLADKNTSPDDIEEIKTTLEGLTSNDIFKFLNSDPNYQFKGLQKAFNLLEINAEEEEKKKYTNLTLHELMFGHKLENKKQENALGLVDYRQHNIAANVIFAKEARRSSFFERRIFTAGTIIDNQIKTRDATTKKGQAINILKGCNALLINEDGTLNEELLPNAGEDTTKQTLSKNSAEAGKRFLQAALYTLSSSGAFDYTSGSIRASKAIGPEGDQNVTMNLTQAQNILKGKTLNEIGAAIQNANLVPGIFQTSRARAMQVEDTDLSVKNGIEIMRALRCLRKYNSDFRGKIMDKGKRPEHSPITRKIGKTSTGERYLPDYFLGVPYVAHLIGRGSGLVAHGFKLARFNLRREAHNTRGVSAHLKKLRKEDKEGQLHSVIRESIASLNPKPSSTENTKVNPSEDAATKAPKTKAKKVKVNEYIEDAQSARKASKKNLSDSEAAAKAARTAAKAARTAAEAVEKTAGKDARPSADAARDAADDARAAADAARAAGSGKTERNAARAAAKAAITAAKAKTGAANEDPLAKAANTTASVSSHATEADAAQKNAAQAEAAASESKETGNAGTDAPAEAGNAEAVTQESAAQDAKAAKQKEAAQSGTEGDGESEAAASRIPPPVPQRDTARAGATQNASAQAAEDNAEAVTQESAAQQATGDAEAAAPEAAASESKETGNTGTAADNPFMAAMAAIQNGVKLSKTANNAEAGNAGAAAPETKETGNAEAAADNPLMAAIQNGAAKKLKKVEGDRKRKKEDDDKSNSDSGGLMGAMARNPMLQKLEEIRSATAGEEEADSEDEFEPDDVPSTPPSPKRSKGNGKGSGGAQG